MMDHWSQSSHDSGVMPRDAECDVCDVLCTGDMTLPWETGTIASDQNLRTLGQALRHSHLTIIIKSMAGMYSDDT